MKLAIQSAIRRRSYWKQETLAVWGKIGEVPEIRMRAEEQCDGLLLLADEYKRTGVINDDNWRELVEGATAFYARAVEGLEGGT